MWFLTENSSGSSKERKNVAIKSYLSVEWNLIRLGGTAHGIVTKTVHKTLLGSLLSV